MNYGTVNQELFYLGLIGFGIMILLFLILLVLVDIRKGQR